MLKNIKKVILSSLSILGISTAIWILFILNPQWSYANKTQFDFVTIHHNQELEKDTEKVIMESIRLIKGSDLFHDDVSLDLCLNDDNIYPHLHPLVGNPLGFSLLKNLVVIKNCKPSFNRNIVETEWAANEFEYRKFKLSWLLAHEFTHNLQFRNNPWYQIKSTMGNINWKLEGHAEYVSRAYKNDGKLKEKILQFLEEQQKEHTGFPVIELEDGTKQILSYFKYGLIVQYLLEQKKLNFNDISNTELSMEELYAEMLEWDEQTR